MGVKVKPKPFLIVLIIIAILLIGFGCSWIYLVGPVNKNSNDDVKITIKSGTSTLKIAEILKENKIIKSKLIFKSC